MFDQDGSAPAAPEQGDAATLLGLSIQTPGDGYPGPSNECFARSAKHSERFIPLHLSCAGITAAGGKP